MSLLRVGAAVEARRLDAGGDPSPVQGDRHCAGEVQLRDCDAITQPPGSTPRRGAISARSFLAIILFDKFGQHQPLNRQSQRFKCEGIDLSVSKLADQVDAGAFAVSPIFELIEAYVLSADRLHGGDTKIPFLVKEKTATGWFWTYVRDDRPLAGKVRSGAVFAPRDRRGEHPARTSPASFKPTLIVVQYSLQSRAQSVAGNACLLLGARPEVVFRTGRYRPERVPWTVSDGDLAPCVSVGLSSCSRSSARSMV